MQLLWLQVGSSKQGHQLTAQKVGTQGEALQWEMHREGAEP